MSNRELTPLELELLDACRIGLNYIEAVCLNTPNPKKRRNYADAASKIRAAISKAEGDGRPSDCSGDTASCPDNEGHGCWCSDQFKGA